MKDVFTIIMGAGGNLFRMALFSLPDPQLGAQSFMQKNNMFIPETHKGKKVAQWKTERKK